MKKIIFFIGLLTTILIGCVCNQQKDTEVIISGKITNPKSDTVEFQLTDTNYIALLKENSEFNISFYLNKPNYLKFVHGDEYTDMYVNPGDMVQLRINTKEFDETIEYIGSPESSFLAWKSLYLKGDVDTDQLSLSYVVVNFEMTKFFKSTDTLFLYLDTLYENIYHRLSVLKNSDFYHSEDQKYQRKIKRLLELHKSFLKIPKQGEPAINFTYPDKDDNLFSLSSFKGSLVYVDVWTTSCGTCIQQFPALKKLAKDYHNKNVVFICICVDKEDRRKRWLNIIQEKEIEAIQLFSKDEKLTQDYAIKGYPRYMLFDAEGNVITTKAPRPSNNEIRVLLDKNL